MSELNFGRGDLMATAAVRYCLGRQSYIVGDCADWLCEQWGNISQQARSVIQRDIEEAFARDDEARLDEQHGYRRALGADMDRAQWERVRSMWQTGGSHAE